MNKNVFLLTALVLKLAISTAWGYNEILGLPDEQLVFSFVVDTGQIVSVFIADDQSYLVCRWGNPEQLILQYPQQSELSQSWNLFIYDYYLRPGEAVNAGLDLNYLYFEDENNQYMIYQEYSAEGNSNQVGIIVTDLFSHHQQDISGDPLTVKGSLINLRDYQSLRFPGEVIDIHKQ
ncbi:MAG: hypothetical protein APR63_01755 [Desulfuromonas sp. SDB]|nr:MAG: hypothetical protein APR63_01755 [Desulfuromonas sp. SDB]